MRTWSSLLAASALALGCNAESGAGDGPGGTPRPLPPDAVAASEGSAETAPDKLSVEPTPPTEPDEPVEVVDLDQSVEQLGAIPAWQAVIERNQYLARRGESAVVFGVVGPAVPAAGAHDAGVVAGDQVWLIDDTEGNGALAIRVRFGALAVVPGARVAVRGAWEVDEERRWVWKATAVTRLPPGEAADAVDPPSPPGLTVTAAEPPPGPRVFPAAAREGDLMEFTVTTLPPRTGDGWGISDRRTGEPQAFLALPGARDSFGGHDLRHADERWRLDKGATYWVRVGKVRRRAGKTTVITAATPPVRFP